MNEEEFAELNDRVIDLGAEMARELNPLQLFVVRQYADAFAKQAVMRAAMQQFRDGRYSLGAMILEGAR